MSRGITRVSNAIRHLPASPVPRGELTLDRDFAMEFLDWWTNSAVADTISDTDLLIALSKALKLDLVCIQSGGPTGNGSALAVGLKDIGRIPDEGLFVFWVVNGVFQSAMGQRGVMPLLTDIAASPEEVGNALRRLSDQTMATMADGVAAGVHGIIMADDIAYHQNTYMSPKFVEQHLVPIWKAQVAAAGQMGVPIFFHSDGNLNTVLPCIAAAGFDGLQCIEPAAGMDIRKIKVEYGSDLCLMGNMDPSLLSGLGNGCDPATQYDRLRRAVVDLMTPAMSGGFIFGTCSGLHAGMSPELVCYMYHMASLMDPVARKAADSTLTLPELK